MAKSCKKGYYYCNTDKKCKKIPRGFHVMPTGYLMRDSEHKDENKDETEGKKKNGNGNGSNGNGNGNGGSNGGSNGGGVSESKDHEVAMAQSQLKKSARNIEKLRKVLGKKEKDIPAWMQAKITDTAHDTDAAAGYADKMNEGTLHKWFSGSKSKDGKGGWVNVTTGGTCASDKPGEGVPKCVSRSKYESMTPAERKSASRRKKKADAGQQSKTGAAKPTYVATDKPKRKTMKASFSNWKAELQLDEGRIRGGGKLKPTDRIKMGGDGGLKSLNDIDREIEAKKTQKNSYEPQGEMVEEGKDRKGKGSGTKDACYHKVKSRYSVWPSAYASGALVKCRKVGAANWGNKSKNEEYIPEFASKATVERMKREGENAPSFSTGGMTAPNNGGLKGGNQHLRKGRKKIQDNYEFSNWRDDFQATEYESIDVIKPEPLQSTDGIGSQMLDEKKRLMNKLDKISGQLRKASAMHKKQSKEVAKVSQHLCAKEVKHEEFGYGETIFGEHSVPDENGFVSHYNVQFEHGIVENVSVEDMKVLTLAEHENHEMDGDVISEGGKKCWKGYKKKGTQKLFGKTYNRCVKAHFSDWRAEMDLHEKKADKDYDGDGKIESGKDEYMGSRDKAIKKAMGKKNCGCGKDPCETYGNQKDVKEDWQKSNRRDGVDGMSQKSVNAYKRENPGSKLQTAVTGKNPTGKDKTRRKSFCARSNGQRKMHNIDCSKTPDKRICKARRRWRC